VEGNGRDLILGIIPSFSGGTEENHEIPQDDRSSGRDLNPWPREYKRGVLAT
jgi:hypothetical protein